MASAGSGGGKRYSSRRRVSAVKDAVAKAGSYAYRDRRRKKRDFRRLWITRISAACRAENVSYSRFINGLAKAEVKINRKALSNMAIQDPEAFKALVDKARQALES